MHPLLIYEVTNNVAGDGPWWSFMQMMEYGPTKIQKKNMFAQISLSTAAVWNARLCRVKIIQLFCMFVTGAPNKIHSNTHGHACGRKIPNQPKYSMYSVRCSQICSACEQKPMLIPNGDWWLSAAFFGLRSAVVEKEKTITNIWIFTCSYINSIFFFCYFSFGSRHTHIEHTNRVETYST